MLCSMETSRLPWACCIIVAGFTAVCVSLISDTTNFDRMHTAFVSSSYAMSRFIPKNHDDHHVAPNVSFTTLHSSRRTAPDFFVAKTSTDENSRSDARGKNTTLGDSVTNMSSTIHKNTSDTISGQKHMHNLEQSIEGTVDNNLFITANSAGRLGNQMFQYAALFAICDEHKARKPFLSPGTFNHLKNAFRNISIPVKNITVLNHIRRELLVGATSRFRNLPNRNITLYGYGQSHAYFSRVENKIRREFRFSKTIRDAVSNYFKNITPPHWRGFHFTRVGIQVRRTDQFTHSTRSRGQIEYPATYFQHAMDHFTSIFSRVQFIVASDDLPWCQEYLNNTNVVFSGKDYVLDLAILTLCDHAIISPGTYSWWAGWLCQGTTVYYGVFPAEGTRLSRLFVSGTWIPPPKSKYNNWISVV